jgi:flagellar biosynthesis/type III secretory pathway M-ring protein FliF/YscJ
MITIKIKKIYLAVFLLAVLLIFLSFMIYNENKYVNVLSSHDKAEIEKIASLLDIESIKYKIKDGPNNNYFLSVKESDEPKFYWCMEQLDITGAWFLE